MTRLEANRELVAILAEAVEEYPDLRFGQLLLSLDVNQRFIDHDTDHIWTIDEVYKESENLLERVKHSSLWGKLK